jgi:hypothetical protein
MERSAAMPGAPARNFRRRCLAGAAALVSLVVLAASASADRPGGKTLGFAISIWRTALYETKDGKEECPAGLNPGGDEIWLSSLTPAERDRLTKHGTVETLMLRDHALERGPHGEDICWNPTLVKDPPQKTVQGRISYGLNLDGSTDGHATANTCAHEKFVTPTGEAGIDNQWYRVIGCTYGWRAEGGYIEEHANGELHDGGHPILMEIKGVEDLSNSPNVEVTFLQSTNGFEKDNNSAVLAGASYRIDKDYRYTTHGSIKNGVLTTEPIDVHFPFYAHFMHTERFIRGARLNVEIAPDGRQAKGLVAGYYDLESFWSYLARLDEMFTVARFDCPALYEAIHRLADGYPDPKTGNCTAMSAAFHIEAVSAFIIDPEDKPAKTAQAGMPDRAAGLR